MGPAATVLTLTPRGLYAAAHACANNPIAAFVVPYAAPSARPIRPAMLPLLMMLPVPRGAIPGANAATTANGARTLTASKPSNPARLGRAVATRDRVTTALKSYVGAGRRLSRTPLPSPQSRLAGEPVCTTAARSHAKSSWRHGSAVRGRGAACKASLHAHRCDCAGSAENRRGTRVASCAARTG